MKYYRQQQNENKTFFSVRYSDRTEESSIGYAMGFIKFQIN